jgi:hypothetical protein
MLVSFYCIALLVGIFSTGAYLVFGNTPKEYTRAMMLVLLILITGLLTESVWEARGSSDSFLLFNALYVYLRPTFMLLLFSQLPYSCQLQKKVVPTMLVFLILGGTISVFLQSPFTGIQSYAYLLGHGLVLFYSIIFFKDLLAQSRYKDTNLLSLPYFWIASLVLFSFGESYILFILAHYFPSLGSYGRGQVFQWVQFFGAIMYLSLGLSFYAPLVFKRRYSY